MLSIKSIKVICLFICILLVIIAIYIYNDNDKSSKTLYVFSIGIYSGSTPFNPVPHPYIKNQPVLTAEDVNDVPARFVADPFMIFDNEKWHMFFEVFNSLSEQGDIGYASSENGLDWYYKQIVLDEPFHLSYPYVFRWNDTYYMIPESRGSNAIKLYEAFEFPTRWSFVKDLVVGNYADPSIVYKNGKWWLFALREWDDLALFFSDNLTGPWIEHPQSPIIKDDKNTSRPGGRIIIVGNKIIRFVQDGEPKYGNAVRVFQVDVITNTKYKEHELSQSPILKASGNGWNSTGMHHIDAHQLSKTNWIMCVDGYSPSD
jgi:hypothetical protein